MAEVELYIIIADDDVEDHELIKKAVIDCELNHIVTSVFNGEQLMNLLKGKEFYGTQVKRIPDLIILDLKMQVMDGFTVLEKLKKDENYRKIPVHVLCESREIEDREKAMALGAISFNTKPFVFEELKSIIRKICDQLKEK